MAPARTVGIVEDDEGVLRGLRELLRGEGYRVVTAGNGTDGLAMLLRSRPDLALLDIGLPGLTGLEVCRRARSEGFKGKVIFISARTDPADRVVGLEAGADDYVPKPFDTREILARLRAHLRADDAGTTGKSGRHLLAVMFADMKDFSRRMHEDDALAIELLRVCQRAVAVEVRRHAGRTVEVTGDGFLIAFASALNAVECALAIQGRLRKRNEQHAAQERARLRIGIDVGDVIEESNHLRGDAVNIAARLQQLCQPDGILVSESVVRAAKTKVGGRAIRVGERRVKNIREPIVVYRIKDVISHVRE